MLGNVAQTAEACTGIRLIAADGSVVYARTLEFGLDLKSEIMMVPRGYARTGITPDGKEGLTWTTKYASVGMNGAGSDVLFDGLNEKSALAAGIFYFPTSAGYMTYTGTEAGNTISQWQVLSYILENFATVDEVKANLDKIVVASAEFEQWGFAPEAHYVVHDPSGKSIVIEYVGGELNVHDNPLGVITNSPTFDWHMNNLRQYVNFSLTGEPPIQLGDVKIVPTGRARACSACREISRRPAFVRAVAFSQSVFQPKTEEDAVLQAFKILNNFDIPKGSARDGTKDENGNIQADYTMWTGASDLKARRYLFRTYDNSQIRSVDLMNMDIDGKNIVTVSISGDEEIKNVTPAIGPSKP